MKKNIITVLTVLLLIFVTQNSSYAQDNEKDYEPHSLNQTN